MTRRAIIRHPRLLSGRWHFEGTTIPIATLLADFQYGKEEALEQYQFMELTAEEIEAAIAFAFPAVREASVGVHYAALVLSCECGEDVHSTAAWPNVERIRCLCGRRWRVPLGLERDAEDASPDTAP